MIDFSAQLNSMIGKLVRLGRGGPWERKGYIVATRRDYLSLYTTDGQLIHYPLQHLTCCAEVAAAEADVSLPSRCATEVMTHGMATVFPPTFSELVTSQRGNLITVSDHGPESATGFLFDVGADFIQLATCPHEIVYYPLFHIRSLSVLQPKGRPAATRGAHQEVGDRNEKTAANSQQNEAKKQTAGGKQRGGGDQGECGRRQRRRVLQLAPVRLRCPLDK